MAEEKRVITIKFTKNAIAHPEGLSVSPLRWVRESRGATQQVLAEASGVPQNTISRAEGGKRKPHKSTLKKLAAALEVEDWTALDVDVPDILALEDLAEWEPERRRRLFELYREVGFLDRLRESGEAHYRENRERYQDSGESEEYIASKLESAYMLGYARGFEEGGNARDG